MKYVLHYAELEILHFDSRQKSYKTNKKLKKSKKNDFKKILQKNIQPANHTKNLGTLGIGTERTFKTFGLKYLF